jgi:death-on-curing family protein
MAGKSRTVKQLAQEAGVDADEVLVTLWDLNINNVLGPNDRVRRRQVDIARRALGVATRDAIRSLGYWRMVLGITPSELADLLEESGFPVSPQAQRVPQGAVSKLKVEVRRRGIDPLTGRIGRPRLAVRDTQDAPAVADKVPQQAEVFVWRAPGHERDLRFVSVEEVEAIHFDLVQDFAASDDPMKPPGIRSKDLLASAVFRPHTSIGSVMKYPTIETSAAALLHAIIQDHPFHNGNKRTALVSMLVMLDQNGLVPICNEDELFKLVLQVAQHRITDIYPEHLADREVLAIADWIFERSRLVEKGERPIPWRRLRGILRAYHCDMERLTGRMNITRKLKETGIFGLTKTITLQTQVFYGDDGRDVKVDAIKTLREELHLDDMHGVDSYNFYSNPTEPADFIAKYRKTLYRLAKL